MAVIRACEPINLHSIGPAMRTRILQRGDGLDLLLDAADRVLGPTRISTREHNLEIPREIPVERDVAEIATHEVTYERSADSSLGFPIDGLRGLEQPQPLLCYFGNADGTNRPKLSKCILTEGWEDVYFCLTWSDLFGYSVKEQDSATRPLDVTLTPSWWRMSAQRPPRPWILYTRKANEIEKQAVLDALAAAAS